MTQHGTDLRGQAVDRDTEAFFRAVDAAVLERYSRPLDAPLLLAALPEHHALFRRVTRNRFLMEDAIDLHPDSLAIDDLRERAWQIVLPSYLERLDGFIEQFGAARAEGRGAADLAETARAAVASRIATLLVDADRLIPGRFDSQSGAIEFARLEEPGIEDLIDDIGEHVLRTGGEVVVVPAERMPTNTGVAAIYRY